MEDTAITSLVKYILPTGITDYFTIKEVKGGINALTIFLDEKNILPEDHKEKPLESKGFYPEARIEDFPIREHKVYLIVRRRKWKNLDTGKQINTKMNNLLKAKPNYPLVIDWEGVPVISSSFADEMIGKLFIRLGAISFSSLIRNVNMEPLIRNLLDKAISQRLTQAMDEK